MRQTLRQRKVLTRESRVRYDGVVKRLIRVLFLFALLAPQVASVAVASDAFCEEASGCCTPEGVCDVNCVHCACCTSRTPSLAPFQVAEPVPSSPRLAIAAASASPPQALPTDIFHVPKSL